MGWAVFKSWGEGVLGPPCLLVCLPQKKSELSSGRRWFYTLEEGPSERWGTSSSKIPFKGGGSQVLEKGSLRL